MFEEKALGTLWESPVLCSLELTDICSRQASERWLRLFSLPWSYPRLYCPPVLSLNTLPKLGLESPPSGGLPLGTDGFRCPSPSCPSSTTPNKRVMRSAHCLFHSSCSSFLCYWAALSNSSMCWRELVAIVFEVYWIIVSHRKWLFIQNCSIVTPNPISFPFLSSTSTSSSFVTMTTEKF